MLTVVLENGAVALTGLALLLYLGAGLTRWLPPALGPYRALVAPWAGYCLLAVITQFLTNPPFALTALQSAYVALGAATLLNGYALLRARSAQAEPSDAASPGSQRELLWVGALALGMFVLAVLPLWSYGYTTVIGENWDAEIYMGLGEYLKVYPQSGLAAAAPNPVLDTLINPPYSLRTHGFSYFQSALGFLPLDSLHTLALLLALMRALSLPAAYVLFRVTLRLGVRAALVASAALWLNAFLLWVTYNTFGMQVPAFGLLPLSVCLAALAFAGKDNPLSVRSAAAWAGLLLAGTAVTYHPALTAFAAMSGPVFLMALVRGWREGGARVSRVRRIVLSGLVMALVGAALSVVSQLKSLEGFLKQYGEKTGGLGLTGFTSPADALGFSLSFRDLLPANPGRPLLTALSRAYDAWGWAALVVALVLVGYYIYRLRRAVDKGESTWEQAALLAGAVIYTLLFLRPLNYPYGWFKALSFVSFVPIGMAVGGIALLGQGRGRVQLAFTSAASALLLVPLLATTWLTVGMYWGDPIRFDSNMLEVGAVRSFIRPGAGVYVSNSPNMRPLGRLFNGLLSYYLRDTDLYGEFQTANSKLDRLRPDGLYSYSLLNSEDRPSEYGVANASLLWHNSIMSLYASPLADARRDIYHHSFREDGTYPTVTQGGPGVVFGITAQGLDFKGSGVPAPGSPASAPLQFSLGLAALVTTTVQVSYSGISSGAPEDSVVVPPGYTLYRSRGGTNAPGKVTLSVLPAPGGDAPGHTGVYVQWAHLEKYTGASGQEPGLSADGAALIASVNSAARGNNIEVDVGYLDNRPQGLSQTLSLDVYGADRGHFGYWNFEVPSGRPSNLRLGLDPARKSLVSATLNGLSTSPAGAFAGATGDGRYTASLLVYEKGQVVETFNDIFTFTIEKGAMTDFRPRSLPPLFR